MYFKFLYSHFHLKLFILGACFLFLAQQGFASISVPISGKVESYKKGVYTVRTSTALIHIKRSKIGYALDQKLDKSIGKRIQVDIPPSVISSFRQTSRRPSSNEDEDNDK